MLHDLNIIYQLAHSSTHRQELPGYEEDFVFYQSLTGYIHFVNKNIPKNKILTGWKFIISVHPEDFARTWANVKDILLSKTLGSLAFKILDLQMLKPNYVKNGEQIVLYAFKTPNQNYLQSPQDLFNLLLALEKILRVNRIRPGVAADIQFKIAGSRYISMRHDRDPDMNYISSTDALKINPENPQNPFNVENPYHDFNMCSMRDRFFSQPYFGFYQEMDHYQKSLNI